MIKGIECQLMLPAFDIYYFRSTTQLHLDQNRVWLLVYDMHLRNFDNRESKDLVRQQNLYEEAQVQSESQYNSSLLYIHNQQYVP